MKERIYRNKLQRVAYRKVCITPNVQSVCEGMAFTVLAVSLLLCCWI